MGPDVRALGKASTVQRFRKVKNTHTWVLFMLLAYAGQLLGLGAHAGSTVNPAMHSSFEEMANASAEASLPCHGDGDTVAMLHSPGHSDRSDTLGSDTQASDTKNIPQSCCETDCSMSDCHMGSAALASYHMLVFFPSQVVNTLAKPGFASISSSSLYRPPILG